MPNFFRDNDDINFYLNQWIDWSAVVELVEAFGLSPDALTDVDEAKSFYVDVLDLVGQFVAEEVAPHAAQIDREGIDFNDGEPTFPERLASIFKKLDTLELHGMAAPRELGGQNIPFTILMLQTELFSRADPSVTTHYSFIGGIAMIMLAYSIEEGSTMFDPDTGVITETRFRNEIAEIIQGKAWGSMDITEPNAGSDMANLRCKAELDADGNWLITGQKIFITSGHGKYHFVIARSEFGPNGEYDTGLDGLSIFLVPAFYEDAAGKRTRTVFIDRVEEKMGHHASATCSVRFERSPGYLVGRRGEGFRYMLTLMNHARIGVGFESIGQCEAAYRRAKAYAAERPSMGKTIDKHEMIADLLDEMEIDIIGLRALAMEAVLAEEKAGRTKVLEKTGIFDGPLAGDSRVQEHLSKKAHRKTYARRLTPLLKYITTEKAVEMSRRCIQIHGGMGYTKEYEAERLLRDAVGMPIYEGTSQIQALMAMKDSLMGIMKSPQHFIRRLAQARWRSLSARDTLERRVARIHVISLSVQRHLLTRTVTDKYKALKGKPISDWPAAFKSNWDPKKDFGLAKLHAERLIQILSDEAIVEALFKQSGVHPHRRAYLERYLERCEPRCRHLQDVILNTGDRLLSQLDEADVESSAKAV